MKLSGIEWHNLIIIIENVLMIDDIFRKENKTIFNDREGVETALKELKEAKKSKKELLYVIDKTATNDDERFLDAPESISLNPSQKAVFGIANAMCKAKGIDNITPLLNNTNWHLADKIWNRCLLYHRRQVGGKKASYKRKGYIAKYKEIPDFREDKYHKSAKLVYDLKEIEK